MENEDRLFLSFRKLSLVGALLSLTISFSVLIGWFFEIETLKSVLPYFVAMKFNTALSIFSASIAVILLRESSAIKIWKRAVAAILGLFVFSVGSITLYEILYQTDVGIDQLFYVQQPGAIYTPYLGRMAPVTTIIFILTGISVFLLALNIKQKIVQFFAFLAFIISLFSFLGYVFNLRQVIAITYQDWLTPIALHTAIAFIFLMLSILFARPSQGYLPYFTGDRISAAFIRRAFPFITILVTISGLISLYGVRLGYYLGEMGLAFQVIIDLTIFYVVGIWISSKTYGIESEQKILIKKQIEEKEKLNILLQSIGDAVIAIDPQWNVIAWNKGAQNLTGWTKDEVLGRPIKDFLRLSDEYSHKENFHFIEDAMVAEQPVSVSNIISEGIKTGEDVSVSGIASQVRGQNNELFGVIIVLHDETKERAALTARSSFAYASHQLRTPVNKAMWVLESMSGTCKNKKIDKGLTEALNALKSVYKLSEQIVTASEVDQGMVVVKNEKVRLRDVWNFVEKEVKENAIERGINLVFTPFSESATLKTSGKLLKAILAELVENAIQYGNKKSEVKVVVSVSDNTIIFEVHNKGIGIEEEQQALVFTKFFRGSNFKTSEIPGSGLGLYITREYIKLINGKIWFNSVPGEETVFYVSIPLES